MMTNQLQFFPKTVTMKQGQRPFDRYHDPDWQVQMSLDWPDEPWFEGTFVGGVVVVQYERSESCGQTK